jgi:LysM repeat protein
MSSIAEQKLRRVCCVIAIASLAACARVPAPPPHAAPRPPHTEAPPPRSPTSPSTRVYVVHRRETLGDIARCSGVPLATLARDNAIPDPNVLYEGEKLRLPANHHCDDKPVAALELRGSGDKTRARANELFCQASASLDAADFDSALARANDCARLLSAYPRDAQANALRARCHVVAGTAATGLDDETRAIDEFRHALAVDPKLKLDPDTTSPRVRDLVSTARSSAQP